MGLDITAVSNMHYVGQHTDPNDDEFCEEEDHWAAFAYDSFPMSVRGLEGMDKRDIFGSGFMGSGCYQETVQTESHGFRAGSYSGYNHWRDELAQIAGFSSASDYWTGGPAGPDAPFYELVNFADNEGTIGPLAAADLLQDFRAFRDKAREFWMATGRPDDVIKYDLQRYADWTLACELAADGGLISFH